MIIYKIYYTVFFLSERIMQNKLFGVMYAINIVAQAMFSLITPAVLMFCVAWLFVTKASAPEWLYAVLIPLGIIAGLVSMIKFVISATSALERLEKQTKNNKKTRHNNEKN